MAGGVITITREFGSLGRKIARMTAEKLNYAYYDREIIEHTADMQGLSVLELEEFEGKKLTPFDKMLYPLGVGNAKKQEKLFAKECSIMRKLAEKGDCVIVGRCSDYVIKKAGFRNVFSVFIYAPYEQRMRFCMGELKLSQEQAVRYLDGVDGARERFYKYHTGENFHSPEYRHLMLDSSSMQLEDVVDTICQAAKNRAKMF